MNTSVRWRGSILLFVGAGLAAACSSDTDGAAEPWTDSLAAGLDQMESLGAEGAFDDALAIADRMQVPDAFSRSRAWLERVTGGASESALRPLSRTLDALGFDALKDADRAEIEYARAVTLLAAVAGEAAASTGESPADASGKLQRGIDSFGRARAAGGPARLDAVYDLGGLDLAAAEVIRATIPEVSGGPPPPPPQGSAMAADKDDEDPLDLARRGYLAAREHLVERLLLAPDADTRANAELVTRRLRELDEIERQREEQQQEQDQQQQDDSESKDQEGDPKDQDPSDESDPKEGDDESQDPPDDAPDDAPPEDPEDPEDQEDAETPEDEESDAESEPEEAEPEKPEERLMTEEERKRVMERNREYQENGEALKRILRMRRKVPAKRDW